MARWFRIPGRAKGRLHSDLADSVMMVRTLAVVAALASLVGGGGRRVAAQQMTRDTTTRAAADSAVRADTGAPDLSPAPDQQRGVDAEVRAALFELASSRP